MRAPQAATLNPLAEAANAAIQQMGTRTEPPRHHEECAIAKPE